MEHVIKVGGLASDNDYPYCMNYSDKDKNKCYPCSPPGYNETLCGKGLFPPACDKILCREGSADVDYVAKISDWKAIGTDENEIAQNLIQQGPLSVALNA